jgi:hypothetical protein
MKRFLKALARAIQQYFMKLYIRYKGRPGALKKAIRKAKRKHKQTGRRYRVFFLENKYQVLTRSDIQRRKHQKVFGWHVNSTNMDAHKFFDTNNL